MACTHFSAGMMYRINSEGALEFLTIEYTEQGRSTQRKFPGGTNRLSRVPLVYRDETPPQTLRREFEVETGLLLSGYCPNPFEKLVRGGHVQFFYLLEETDGEGKLRAAPKTELEEGRAPELLGTPEWVLSDELLQGGSKQMFGTHLNALEHALRRINNKSPR